MDVLIGILRYVFKLSDATTLKLQRTVDWTFRFPLRGLRNAVQYAGREKGKELDVIPAEDLLSLPL